LFAQTPTYELSVSTTLYYVSSWRCAVCNCFYPAGVPGARALAAAVTDKLDDSQISHISSSSEHEAFLQQQPKLAKV
jgi:hypothetical protein